MNSAKNDLILSIMAAINMLQNKMSFGYFYGLSIEIKFIIAIYC